MIRIVAENFVKPEEKEKFLALASELVDATRTEEDNISYYLHVDQQDANHFTFIEEWKDAEAIRKHNASEHFTRLVPQMHACTAKEGSCILYDVVK